MSAHATQSPPDADRTPGVVTSVRMLLTSTASQCGEPLHAADDLVRWLAWPADCFALTSLVLRTTGCYRLVATEAWRRTSSGGAAPSLAHLMTLTEVHAVARAWRLRLEQELTDMLDAGAPEDPLAADAPPPRRAEDLLAEVWDRSKHVTMEQLRVPGAGEARGLAMTLLELHAIADTALAGVGTVGAMRGDASLTLYLAHLVLVARGSLSSFPKHLGVVLPKMRTPQSGLGLRSLSHYVTCHVTEVDVAWRALPWVNRHQHSLNVLAVPWPFERDERGLVARPDRFENVRYFGLRDESRTGAAARAYVRPVAELVYAAEAQCGNGVHVLVLPELALTMPELCELADLLARPRDGEPPVRHVPAIVTGVSRGPADGRRGTNEVHLMYYFGSRWYDVWQSKHHRWRIDRGQLQQYELQNELSTSCTWLEDIEVDQRRLTFISANGWLTLCPLICEDLARLEPVSEVIRGVGPTLLFALLMDGPQLKARWPARYATVLAEDPGTAVLSLTSFGMARRSRPLREGGLVDPDAHDRSAVVGLWKDATASTAIELEMRPPGADGAPGRSAMLLTVSSTWAEEWTADGRSDAGNAAAFRLDGMQTVVAPAPPLGGAGRPAVSDDHAAPSDASSLGNWDDLRELASVAFAWDTALARGGKSADVLERMLLQGDPFEFVAPQRTPWAPWARLGAQLAVARNAPEDSGITPAAPAAGVTATTAAWPDATLRYGALLLRLLFERVGPADHADARAGGYAFLTRVAECAAAGLRPDDESAFGDDATAGREAAARWRSLIGEARRTADEWVPEGQLPGAEKLDAPTLGRLERQVPELALAVMHARLDSNPRVQGLAGLTAAQLEQLERLVRGIERVLEPRAG